MLYQLQRNLSDNLHWSSKLNAYTGYVVPIITYAAQAWMPNKTNMEQVERIQKSATKWILSSNVDYKDRLSVLGLLPLCHYMELHDLLILTDIVNDRFDYYLKPDNEQSQTRQGMRGEFVTVRSRLVKTGDEYFRRTKTLNNYVLRALKGARPTKDALTKLYWNFFD